MKFIKIEKKEPGKFINRFDVYYETPGGGTKVYEIVSRDKELLTLEDIADKSVEVIVLIMHTEDGQKLLLNREYRMACGGYVYNFPAGLIEPGETYMEAAARELYEETGLHIDKITDKMGISFSAIGFSNEKNISLVGIASGTIQRDHSEPDEEIEPMWVTKEEAAKLLETERFAARTQAYCYLWSRMKDSVV